MSCRHRSAGRCLKGLHGGTPSIAVCMEACAEYDGPSRGAGDIAAKTIRLATFGRLRPCRGCGERRLAMNAAMPFARRQIQPEMERR